MTFKALSLQTVLELEHAWEALSNTDPGDKDNGGSQSLVNMDLFYGNEAVA
jgi:hypothetical protein